MATAQVENFLASMEDVTGVVFYQLFGGGNRYFTPFLTLYLKRVFL